MNRPLANVKNIPAEINTAHTGSGPEFAIHSDTPAATNTSMPNTRSRPYRSASLPHNGAVSAEQKQLHAVPGLGRHEAPGRTPVSCLDNYTTARNRRCTRSRRRTFARRTTFSVVVQVGDRLPLLG